MTLVKLLVGSQLPPQGEGIAQPAYLDFMGRCFVSSMGLIALGVLASEFAGLSSTPWLRSTLLFAFMLFWSAAAIVKVIGIFGHYRRLLTLGHGTAFRVCYVLDLLVTRLFFYGTNIYLGFRKTAAEKTTPQRITIYGRVWQVAVVFTLLLPMLSTAIIVAAASAYWMK